MKTIALCFALLCVCDAISGEIMAGAPRRITDERELNNLSEKVNHYLTQFQTDQQFEVVRTRSATVQIVAGVMYKMTVDMMENQQESQCKIALWEKSWESFAQLNIECGERKYLYVTKKADMKN